MTRSEIVDAVRQLLAECEPRSVQDLVASAGCSHAELLVALGHPTAGVERCPPPDDLAETTWWWTRSVHLRHRMANAARREPKPRRRRAA